MSMRLTSRLLVLAMFLVLATPAWAQYTIDGATQNDAGGWDIPGTCFDDSGRLTRTDCRSLIKSRAGDPDTGGVDNETDCETAGFDWSDGPDCTNYWYNERERSPRGACDVATCDVGVTDLCTGPASRVGDACTEDADCGPGECTAPASSVGDDCDVDIDCDLEKDPCVNPAAHFDPDYVLAHGPGGEWDTDICRGAWGWSKTYDRADPTYREDCLRCHNDAYYTGSRLAVETYVMTGHKNMLRPVEQGRVAVGGLRQRHLWSRTRAVRLGSRHVQWK